MTQGLLHHACDEAPLAQHCPMIYVSVLLLPAWRACGVADRADMMLYHPSSGVEALPVAPDAPGVM